MKRYLPLLLLFIAPAALAQEPADALRFSWNVPGATARIFTAPEILF